MSTHPFSEDVRTATYHCSPHNKKPALPGRLRVAWISNTDERLDQVTLQEDSGCVPRLPAERREPAREVTHGSLELRWGELARPMLQLLRMISSCPGFTRCHKQCLRIARLCSHRSVSMTPLSRWQSYTYAVGAIAAISARLAARKP